MGYACPVCETPQRDGEHLANHLAFTAMLGDEAHEEWLDEHAPGWGEAGSDELARRVADQVPDAEFEAVFEDTVDRSDHTQDGHAHGSPGHHEHEHGGTQASERPPVDPSAARSIGRGSLDADAEEVLREAREMTRELLDDEDAGDSENDGGTDDSENDEDTDDFENNKDASDSENDGGTDDAPDESSGDEWKES